MKITTQKELDDLIATANESNTIVLNEDLKITFDCTIPCNIDAYNITARNIKAWDIKAGNIKAGNIKAWDIKAGNITARNIKAWDIKAGNIKAGNIDAYNITAGNIKADNIEYYAFCIAYHSLECKSISGIRENSIHKCLDQEIKTIKEEKKVTIELTESQLDKIKHLI
jgi:hypothetical protein